MKTKDRAKGLTRALLLDNHSSHYSLDLLDEAVRNGVEIFGYPPHCTHALQGLDVVCFAKLKSAWRRVIREYETRTLRPVGKANFLELFGRAFRCSFDVETIQAAFRVTGIHPFNRDVITADQMKPSEVTSTSSSFPLPLNTPVRRIMAAFHHQPPTRFDVDIETHLPQSNHIEPASNPTTDVSSVRAPQSPPPSPILDPAIDPSLFTPSKRMRSVYASLAMSKSASFLVSKEVITSEDSLPPLALEQRPPYIGVPDWNAGRRCLDRLADESSDDIKELTELFERAKLESRSYQNIAEGAQAQLVLATLHNAKLQVALFEKERGKSGDNVRLGNGMPRVWTSEESREEVRTKQQAKEKELYELELRRSAALKKKEMSNALDEEWRRIKTHHELEVAKWQAQCTKWHDEGLPKTFWDPKPTRPTKKEIHDRLFGSEDDGEVEDLTEEMADVDSD